MMFWQMFGLLSVMAMLFVLWPMLMQAMRRKKTGASEIGSSKASLDVFKDHLSDLQRSLDNQDITQQEFDSLKRDLEKTHNADSNVKDNLVQVDSSLTLQQRMPLWIVALSMPILCIFLYQKLGAMEDWKIFQLARKPLAQGEDVQLREKELVEKLKARLDRRPENASNWYLLASKSTKIGDYKTAVDAFHKLRELEPNSALVVGELAQALFLQAGSKITPDVRENTELALSLSPTNATALGLKGIDAYHSGRYRESITAWTQAVRQLNPSSPAAKAFTQGIAQAQIALATKPSSAKSDLAKPSSTKSNSTSIDSKPKTYDAEAGAAALVVDVSLDASKVQFDGQETVFVYARAWKGAKIPLAIKRFSVKDLPAQISLGISDAMAQGMDITTAPELEILARLSKSGQAVPQSGDWQVSYGPVVLKDQKTPLKLQISEQLP